MKYTYYAATSRKNKKGIYKTHLKINWKKMMKDFKVLISQKLNYNLFWKIVSVYLVGSLIVMVIFNLRSGFAVEILFPISIILMSLYGVYNAFSD